MNAEDNSTRRGTHVFNSNLAGLVKHNLLIEGGILNGGAPVFSVGLLLLTRVKAQTKGSEDRCPITHVGYDGAGDGCPIDNCHPESGEGSG